MMKIIKVISLSSIVFSILFVQSLSQIRFGRYNPNSYRGSSIIWDNQNRQSSAPLRFRNTNEDDSSDETSKRPQFGEVTHDKIKRTLCPGIEGDLDKYRYDSTNQKCSLVGVRSHCGENMVFYGVEHNDIYGECDCIYTSLRPLVYHPQTRKCYYVYDQAYCRRGDWLTFKKNGKAECSFNKCQSPVFTRNASENRDAYVPLNGDGKCVLLNKKSSYCSNSEHVVTFVPDEFTPRCSKEIPIIRAIAVVRKLKCRPGTYLNMVGKCQPAFVW